MDSWWELGEWTGFQGNDLNVRRITCAFCVETGHWHGVFHQEKKKPNSSKRLNFDVYQCHNCAGFVHILWSAAEFGGPLHGYRVLPWPLSSKPKPSENWPEGMRAYWVQAHNSISNENWDAAAVMARGALQFVVRERGAEKGTLYTEIQDLAAKGVLVPVMADWSHEVPLLGRDSAHPELLSGAADPKDAKDIVKFLNFLLMYLYDLPKQVSDYRTRKK